MYYHLTLKFTSDNITHIAYDCGFSEIGYFSKLFRKKYGKSPSEFREVNPRI
ncbi:MAG: helix-turn-helix domain-containing protein [Bacteroidia bacterium]|nr:helix-turn-helix domain-containing protein [Bacteroidia bacterium]